MELNFDPFPILRTERLLLRCLADSDANEILALRSNPESMQFIPRPLMQNREDALAHIKIIRDAIASNDGINWAVTLNGSDELIGLIGFYKISTENHRAEIGYMLRQEYCNLGIVTEAIREIIRYGFSDMRLHSIEAIIDPMNGASERVLQKLGFVKEAHFRENEFFNGQFIDSVHYSLLRNS